MYVVYGRSVQVSESAGQGPIAHDDGSNLLFDGVQSASAVAVELPAVIQARPPADEFI